MVAARAARQLPGARPPFRGIILLEPDLPGWVADKPNLFTSGPLPIPAVVVGATAHVAPPGAPPPSEGGPAPPEQIDRASDEVAKLLAAPIVCTFPEEHRPLPADKARAAEIVETIRTFVGSRCGSAAPPEIS